MASLYTVVVSIILLINGALVHSTNVNSNDDTQAKDKLEHTLEDKYALAENLLEELFKKNRILDISLDRMADKERLLDIQLNSGKLR